MSSNDSVEKEGKGKTEESFRLIYAIVIPFIILYFRSSLQNAVASTAEKIKEDLAKFVLDKMENKIYSIPESQVAKVVQKIFDDQILPKVQALDDEEREQSVTPHFKSTQRQVHPKNLSSKQMVLLYSAKVMEHLESLGQAFAIEASSRTVVANLAEANQQMAKLPVFALSSLVINGICDKLKSILPLPSDVLMNMYWDSIKLEPRLQIQIKQLHGLLNNELPYALRDVLSTTSQIARGTGAIKPGEMNKFTEANVKLAQLQEQIRELSKLLQEGFIQLGQKQKAQDIEQKVKEKFEGIQSSMDEQQKRKPKA